jgi:5'-3' exonuclease
METHLLIDGRNLMYQAHYGVPPLTTSQGHPAGALYGFMQILRRILIVENPDFAIMCWDGVPLHKQEIFPEYKQQRDHSDMDMQAFNRQADAAMEFTKALGIPQALHSELEADDFIAAYALAASELYPKDCHVLIVSTDRDFWQLISKSTSCLYPKMGAKTGLRNFKEKTGFGNASDYLEYKIIVGDVSDNIPGLLKGVGDKKARVMVEEGNYAKLWSSKVLDSKIIQRQYELMDLSRMSLKVRHGILSVLSGILTLDYAPSKVFRGLCSRWEFFSMNHENWVLPFETLYNKAKKRRCFGSPSSGPRAITHFKKALLRAIQSHDE